MRKLILLLVILAAGVALRWPASAFVASWAHDGTGCSAGVTGTAATGTCNLTVGHVGNLLVAGCDAASLSNTCTIKDSANTGSTPWTLIANCSMGRAIAEIYSTVSVASGATTVTATWSAGSTGSLFADSYQWNLGSPAIPAPTNANSGTPFCSATATSGNITGAQVNALPWGYGDVSTTLSAGSGYTQAATQVTNGVTRTLAEYNAATNAGGTIAISFTAGGTAHGMMGVAFSPTSGVTSRVPRRVIALDRPMSWRLSE